jgi:WD40 repeat protein
MENIDWSPDSRQIVTGSINGVIYVWNAETGEALARFAANPHAVFDELTGPKFPLLGWVRDVRFMPDGNTILSASADGTVQLYDIATQKAVETKQYAQIAAASFSPLTTRLAYLSFTVSDSGFPAGVTIRQRLSSKGLEMDVPFANRERFNRLVAVCGVTADSSASPESVLNTLGTRKDDPHAALCVNELSPMAAGLKNAP